MSDVNIAIVHRWFDEVWNQRRAETIDELLSEESTCHGDGVSLRGPQQFRQQQFEPLIQAFPDLQSTIDAIICQGDEVAVRWSGWGHHSGPGLGIPPTGELIELRGMTWITIRNGQLVEGWQRSNIREEIERLGRQADTNVPASRAAAAPF